MLLVIQSPPLYFITLIVLSLIHIYMFAVVTSAFLFGLMHGNIPQFVFAFILGIGLGLCVIVSDSVWPAIAAHFLNNFMSIVLDDIIGPKLTDNEYIMMFIIYMAAVLVIGIVAFIIIIKKYRKPKMCIRDRYFNKKQQQTLLEYMEDGSITLIASTTENPYFYVYGAVLSRSTVFEFKMVEPEDVVPAIKRAYAFMEQDRSEKYEIDDDVFDIISVSYTHLDVYKRQTLCNRPYVSAICC